MYNLEPPTRAELPSSKQLIRSTIVAALTAGVLLITTVLPAEYGVDPTGIGNLLGLKRMGEIKVSLAKEAAQTAAPAAVQSAPSPAPLPQTAPMAPTHAAEAAPVVAAVAAEKEDEVIFTLKPGEAAEFKLRMSMGAKAKYQWVVRGGAVNFDTHGDPINPSKGAYHGYGKGKQSMGDHGVLIAAFDGQHGWFWRNRSAQNSAITLTTKGEYSALKRVL
jgi:hypothetical protein